MIAIAQSLEPLALDLLNAVNVNVAVIDAGGAIVAVNEPWRRFAIENGGSEAGCGVGASYLAACDRALREPGGDIAAAMRSGIAALLSGGKERFTLEYPCHAPGEKRWFVAEVTRFMHEGLPYVVAVHANITARRLAQEALQRAESTLRNVLEALPVGVWIMDAQGTIVHGNEASRRIWAGALYVGPERFGEYKGWWLDSGRRIAPEEWAAARAIRKGETSIDEEIRIECFDGTGKIILNSAIPLHDAEGAINGAIIVNQDITARKRVEAKLLEANAAVDAVNRELQEVLARERLMARTDELTGLRNRRHFYEVAGQMFAVAKRYGSPFCIVMFDLDHFKRLNDLHGHQAGDAVLRCVGSVAGEQLRAADVLARYGGEEFIVALSASGAHEAFTVAEKIRERIAGCGKATGDAGVRLTASAGIAELSPADADLDGLIRRADEALYLAKRSGRDRSLMA